MPIYVSVFIPVLDLALVKTRRKSFYRVKLGEIRFTFWPRFDPDLRECGQTPSFFGSCPLDILKLATEFDHKKLTDFILGQFSSYWFLVCGLLIKEPALRFLGIILVHRWSCLLMLNKLTHTRISWELYYILFQFSLGNDVFRKKYCSLQPWRQYIKKSRLLGSGNFGFSKASLRFRLYDPVSALTIFDCFSRHLLRGFLTFFSIKFDFWKKWLILKLADGRAIISAVESAEYESQRLAREDMTSRKRITNLI